MEDTRQQTGILYRHQTSGEGNHTGQPDIPLFPQSGSFLLRIRAETLICGIVQYLFLPVTDTFRGFQQGAAHEEIQGGILEDLSGLCRNLPVPERLCVDVRAVPCHTIWDAEPLQSHPGHEASFKRVRAYKAGTGQDFQMPFHEPGIKPWPQAELEEKDVVQDGITHPEHIQLYSVNLNGMPSYHFLFINISELPTPQQAAHQRGIILLDTPRFHSERSP